MAAELKTKLTDENVEAYLDRVCSAAERQDCAQLMDWMTAATGAPACMWGGSIIGFGRYRYQYDSGRSGEWMLIGFAPRKKQLSIYIMPGFERYEVLMSQLGKHRTGKSCLYIKSLAEVDQTILKTLIEESVKAMADRRVD